MTSHPLTTVFVLGALLFGGCSATQDDADPTTTVPASGTSSTSEPTSEPEPDVEQDPELAAQLAELIVGDLPAITLKFSNNLMADCQTSGLGCYSPTEATLLMQPGLTDFRQPEILAHEYLHHVWFTDELDEDAELTVALAEAYADAEGLGSLVPHWQSDYVNPDGSIEPTELFSYACTGLRPDQMVPVLAERCQQYLNLDALPINQHVEVGELREEVTSLRAGRGLEPFADNAHAAAASQARADLFTPYSQVPLNDYPDSVTQHLEAGCQSATYGVRLTRPYDPAQIVVDMDKSMNGALTASEFTDVGIAVKEFDFISPEEVFGDRTVRVNTSLIIITLCT